MVPAPSTETEPLHHCLGRRGDVGATFRLIFTSGAGLLADGYDLQVVNLVLAILAHVYPERITPAAKSFIAAMTLVGVILGQLTFGILADNIGRRTSSIITAVLTIVGAAVSACVSDFAGGIALQLGLCRFLLGLGIGGEYPLSAALSKEAESKLLLFSRSQLLIFNMLLYNIGSLLQASLVAVLLAASVPLGTTWRLALAGGCVPSAVAAMMRFSMEEPDAVHREMQRGAEKASSGYLSNLMQQVGSRWTVLLGAGLSWFLFNFTAYGHGSFSSIICDRLLGQGGDTGLRMVKRDAAFALLISGTNIAGSLVGLAIERYVSPRSMQATAFFFMAIPLWIVGATSGHGDASTLAFCYLFSVFMMPFLGITTYLIPTQNFPPSARGTCVGIAAATGKMGAAVGTALFPLWESHYSLNMVLVTSGFVSLAGMFVTALLTPCGRAPDDEGEGKGDSKGERKGM